MKISVIGAGAIGNLVAAYLKTKGEDVSLVGHSLSVNAIKENGLQVSGVRGDLSIKIDVSEKIDCSPDLIILATKTQDIDSVFKGNQRFIKDSTILTTQNGIRADDIVGKYAPKENIISSIVMFGSTLLEPSRIVHNFEGSWIIGKAFGKNDEQTVRVSSVLDKAFPAILAEDIKGMKYLKIFVNANNCIAAILGISMQEAFSDINISAISISIWKEGLDIVKNCGIDLVPLPDFPTDRITKLTSLPRIEAAKIFSGIMTALSKEPLYGSILQSIKRGRTSEIDYINGEFVSLAKEKGLEAPLNEMLVKMVHEVEIKKSFFTKEELLSAAKQFIP